MWPQTPPTIGQFSQAEEKNGLYSLQRGDDSCSVSLTLILIPISTNHWLEGGREMLQRGWASPGLSTHRKYQLTRRTRRRSNSTSGMCTCALKLILWATQTGQEEEPISPITCLELSTDSEGMLQSDRDALRRTRAAAILGYSRKLTKVTNTQT